ncbi:MAG: hypothetical protein V3V08_02010 [Nannocystaceae bacterium]
MPSTHRLSVTLHARAAVVSGGLSLAGHVSACTLHGTVDAKNDPASPWVGGAPAGSSGPTGETTATVAPTATGDGTTEVEEGTPCVPGMHGCPPGFKCSPHAASGEGCGVDAARCVVGTGEGALDDACDRDSGLDNCAAGLFCLVDFCHLSGPGRCSALCDPSLPDACSIVAPGRICVDHHDGWLPLCMTGCHPFLGACPSGELCEHYSVELGSEGAVCAVAGGATLGTKGQVCDPPISWCEPGLHCSAGGRVPGCPKGAAGCCTPWCDVFEGGFQCKGDERCDCVYDDAPSDFCRMGSCGVVPAP